MDEKYMKLALELALKGKGKVSPNPMVGAVIVKNGRLIAHGYHELYGEAHAEINAFKNANEDAARATMYVTLEPCSHYGKTPPCVDKIIEEKISRVVIGCLDPNPLVAGRGVQKLIEAGIKVTVGVLEEQCKKVNEIFTKYIVEKQPFVIMKSAMSLDGKIAAPSGESKWITGEKARYAVHQLRNEVSAIMVGVNTVINDDPELTCRIEGGNNPVRIIVDSTLRIPLDSKIVKGAKEIKTIIATTERAGKEKLSILQDKGIEVLITKLKKQRVDLRDLMIKLGKLKIDSILLEGGASLNFSALEEGIVDKVQIYIAPIIIGGELSKTSVEGSGIEFLKNAFKVENLAPQHIGEDILLEGYIVKQEVSTKKEMKICLLE